MDAATRQVRILLVDDHPIVREGLRRLVQETPDLTVCGEAESVQEAKALLRKHEPEILVVDLSLKNGEGLELVREARKQYPRLTILVLSMQDELLFAPRLLTAGANGYLMKREAATSFVSALRQLLNGKVYVSETVSAHMIDRYTGGTKAGKGPLDILTDRELEVLSMIGRGMSTKDVGNGLHLSIKTVESHRQRIKHKLRLKTNAQLVQFALNWSAGRPTKSEKSEN